MSFEKMYCLIPFNPPMLYFGVLHLTFWGTPTIRMLRVRTLKMQAFKDEWLLGWMCTDTGSEEVLVELCSFWLGNSYLNIRLPFLLFWFMSPMTNDTVFCRWSWRYWCLFWLLEHKYHLPASENIKLLCGAKDGSVFTGYSLKKFTKYVPDQAK